jgi:hypothetical protein
MKKKVVFLLSAIGAFLLTSLLYFLDTDPPYPEFRTTVIEFSIITTIFFVLFITIYYVSKLVNKYIKF